MLTMLSLLIAASALMPDDSGKPTSAAAASRPVVFICEHGSVKSLIATEWFNRLAQERGLSVRAISTGVTPDAAVPAGIVEALRNDGFDVGAFTPRRVDAATLSGAPRIVAMGLKRDVLPASPLAAVETWEAIPPATEQYAAARDDMKARIEALLKSLEASGSR